MSLGKSNINVQILRGISVTAIISYHFFPTIFLNSYLGVDIFFMLSGYVLYPRIIKASGGKYHLRIFFRKRLFRLLPTLGFVTVYISIPLFLFASFQDFLVFLEQALYTFLILGNFSAYKNTPTYFEGSANPYIHTWSLSTEEQLLILAPIFTFIILKLRKKYQLYLVFLIVIFSLILFCMQETPIRILFGLNNFNFNWLPNLLFYMPFTRIWEFAIGGILFKFKKNIIKYFKVSKLYFFWTLFLFIPHFNLSFILIPFLLIITGLICVADETTLSIDLLNKNNKSLLEKLLIKVGNASYSIYLIHMPLAYLAVRNSILFNDSTLSNFSKFFIRLLYISLVFFLGFIIHNKVEITYIKLELVGFQSSNVIRKFMFLPVVGLLITLIFSNVYAKSIPTLPKNPAGNFIELNCKSTDKVNRYPCLIENESGYVEQNILLIGDSHVRQFIYLIKSLSINSHTNFYYLDNFNFNEIKKLEKNIYFKKTVVGFYWSAKPQKIDLLKSYLEQTVVKTLVIGEFPISKKFKTRLEMTFLQQSKDFSVVFAKKADLDSNSKNAKYILTKIIDVHPNTSYLDPYIKFCNLENCRFALNGHYLYQDSHHLTGLGVEQFKLELLNFFENN